MESNIKAYEFCLMQKEFMDEICRPLVDFLNISHFCYLRIYKNSDPTRYFYISNSEKITQEKLMNEKAATSGLFFAKFLPINDLNYKAILWPEKANNYEMEICINNGYWNGITIHNQANEEYIEIWGFAPSLDQTNIYDLYQKHCFLLINFIHYFDSKLQQILPKDINKILALYKKFDFHISNDHSDIDYQKIRAFIAALYPKGIELKTKNGLIRLTKRELECLEKITQSMSAKEIARELSMSPRTVEKHIQSLHYKSGYNLRSDLTKLYKAQIEDIYKFMHY